MLIGGAISGSRKNDIWRSTDNGGTWTQLNASADWTARYHHRSVVMPDGSIVLTGGHTGSVYKNDVWRSTDNGVTWTQMTANAGWSARYSHSAVAMPDGSIILMGGNTSSGYKNDVWRSVDYGVSWIEINTSAGWAGRSAHWSVVQPDGSILLMGGWTGSTYLNDTWRSTDNGISWTELNASAGWSARFYFNSVAMPDGSVVLIGGKDASNYKNDTWRSTDNGATWIQVNTGADWTARYGQSDVAMPDGSIVQTGGHNGSYRSDVWRFMPMSSSTQNPSHTYTLPGMYQVSLQAYHGGGYNNTILAHYITVTESEAPVANFTADKISGSYPLTVQFNDTSMGGTPTAWNWSFGNGTWFNTTDPLERNATYTYNESGTYTVKLYVSNSLGGNTTEPGTEITVTDPIVAPEASSHRCSQHLAPTHLRFSSMTLQRVERLLHGIGRLVMDLFSTQPLLENGMQPTPTTVLERSLPR